VKQNQPLYFMLIVCLLVTGAGCGLDQNGEDATALPGTETEEPSSATQPAEMQTLTIMTHDSFAASEAVIQAFEQEHNARLIFLKSGDTGSALNRAILSRANPLADVFYGVDNTFLTRALEEEIFEPYASPVLDDIPDVFQLDPQQRALPVDYGDVCINYDRSYFEENNLAVPISLEDLLEPHYNGLLVVENPAVSSTGLAFLLATIDYFGENGFQDYWQSLRENGVVVVNDWETAYYTNFSGSSGNGPQPMVVSYGSSPAAEVIFSEIELTEAPTASITGPGTCFRQIEFVGILAGTQKRALAEAFVDFLLGETFQADMPEQMFVFPINQNVTLPAIFAENVQIPEDPAMLDIELIASNREEWIQAWTQIMLR
jgi:thiamine transport system substrate-binding protein